MHFDFVYNCIFIRLQLNMIHLVNRLFNHIYIFFFLVKRILYIFFNLYNYARTEKKQNDFSELLEFFQNIYKCTYWNDND